MVTPARVVVVIPALNEEAAIGCVLSGIPEWVSMVIVADNGSTDGTAHVARSHGATVVHEPRRGYGAACLRALAAMGRPDIVVFIDADDSDDPREMDNLVGRIRNGEADLVIGSRVLGHAAPGSMTIPQRFGNVLASALLRLIYGQTCTDLGPFRAIRFQALQALLMDDLDYGWTVQMQARAMRLGLRVVEVPVSYKKRIGRSKISGTVRGVAGAGSKILWTIAREALQGLRERKPANHLLVFTRYPESGNTKTRLIPALGPEGAANLQREMTHHVLGIAETWKLCGPNEVVVYFADGDEEAMRNTFGRRHRYVRQGEGDLGARLIQGFEAAAGAGAERVIAVGADCPSMTRSDVQHAFHELTSSDVVIGPSSDGGYYLIGMREPCRALFADIPWGTAKVFDATISRAKEQRLSVTVLDTKTDIDEPDDLYQWSQFDATASGRDAIVPTLSIIIPTVNEAENLPETLAVLGDSLDIEIIVADAGSSDATALLAEQAGVRVLQCNRGRAAQMNAGADAARASTLLFLHADTRPPFGYKADPISLDTNLG